MEWYEILISILTALTMVLPLVVKLCEYVQKAQKEKNWTSLLVLVTNLMETAEVQYKDGVTKKQFVMAELESLSSTLNYDIDWEVVSTLIDDLVAMSKKVNSPSTVQDSDNAEVV